MKKTSQWQKIKYLLSVYKELRRAARPRTLIGYKLIYSSLISVPIIGWGIIFGFDSLPFLNEVEISRNKTSIMFSVLSGSAFLFGAFLIGYDIRQEERQSRNSARLFIDGLPNMNQVFPETVLSAAERLLAREPITLGVKSNEIENQVEMYNAEAKVGLISRFVTHHGCQKLYIGGLARIPFLVGYGAMLRNASGITYFEKMHSKGGQWSLLDDEDDQIEVVVRNEQILANDDGAIGIALGMSTEVVSEQLPDALRGHTFFIDASGPIEKDKVKNQENLHAISTTIAKKIDSLSTKAEVKSIHLFLSVQSTMALEIGRRYQEGTQKPWVIYNYNAESFSYSWALRLSGQRLTIEL